MLQTVKILFDKVSSRGVDESEREILTEQEIEARGIRVIY
jgi:hypothetical protein